MACPDTEQREVEGLPGSLVRSAILLNKDVRLLVPDDDLGYFLSSISRWLLSLDNPIGIGSGRHQKFSSLFYLYIFMHLPRYVYKTNDSFLDYEFVSEGPRGNVKKVVRFSQISANVFNLAFGDLDEATGDISDTAVTNNNDSRKVLATVLQQFMTLVFSIRVYGLLPKAGLTQETGCTEWEFPITGRKLTLSLKYMA